jgi:hypothetical protein
VARPRLKAPKGQQPRDDLKPQPRPVAPIPTEPAQFLYEAYATAKGYRIKGPGSERLKLWYELAAKDRSAWQRVAVAYRLANMEQSQVIVPALQGRDQVGVYVMDPVAGAWRSSIQARDDDTGIVRNMKRVVAELFSSLDEDQEDAQ